MKFILTGVTGNLGSRVLQCILDYDLIPTEDLIISTTSPHKVAMIAKQNDIPLIPGDLTRRDELFETYATSGADALFLISYPGPSLERFEFHRNAIDAAVASKTIRLVVYTSLMFGGQSGMVSEAGVQQAHIRTVEYLQQCGLQHVVIREGIYAQSWGLYAGFVPTPLRKEDQEPLDFVVSTDGPVAWVSWDDLAEGNARVLASLAKGEDVWIGKSLRLTGPRASKIADFVPLVERWTGRKVTLRVVGTEEAIKYYLEQDGVAKMASPRRREDWVVKSWAGWHQAIARGECAMVDPLLQDLLRREPKGISECAEELFAPL